MPFIDESVSAPSTNQPIAIIGIGVRAPGDASDPEKFWQMLLDARSARSEIPKDRYNVDGFYHPDPERLGSIQQRHAHFLKQDFKVFDAPFFSVTPKEAKAMDPTQRMLLEAAYEGFENAGLRLEDVSGTQTSCYIGTFTNDFVNLQAQSNEAPSIYHATGLSSSLASNRLSWFYNLKGPSVTVDTACSSSLTAFHLGCQSIRTGEAEMSVVAGANLMFGPDMSILLGAAKILSPDGKSKMWDAKANGFARGEGFGVTILKPLEAALRDGDTIRAVVLASAANEDGRTPGISLPNSEAQQALIRKAYRDAGVDPAETGYVEAHGTGTQAGDPLEARAILNTIGDLPNRKSDLYVGSVKTNIGHLEGAAGVAGIIKAAFAVERGLIPQNLWFEELNPQIELPENVKVPTTLTVWPGSGPRRASINSFGFGGANAHVILEDAASYLFRHGRSGRHYTTANPKLLTISSSVSENGSETETISDVSHEEVASKLFVLSSNDQEGVKRNVERLASYLDGKTSSKPSFLSDLAYTLFSKRTTLPWKSFAIASDVSSLRQGLEKIPAVVRSSNSSVPRIAFVFTGQGAQYFQMGKELSVYKTFRDSMLRSELILKSLGCPWTLTEELDRDESGCNLRRTDYSQPVCTALQVALADLCKAWGVKPVASVGHSSGEIAAAYCAGFIDHEAAVKIAWLRGQVSQTVSKSGGMLAVSASAESISEHLEALKLGKAIVGCFNSPKACTVSGDNVAIDELQEILKAAQIPCTRLPMDVAYHSFHMEAARERYEEALAGIPHGSSDIPMFSSVTGKQVAPEQMTPSYWVDNLVSPVNFVNAVKSLLHHTEGKTRSHDRTAFASAFVELGPHSALRSYLLDIFATENRFSDLSYTTVLRRKFNGVQTALEAMGQLWSKGCDVDINRVNEVSDTANMLVDLPPYAWNHTRTFWEESYLSREYRLREKPRSDLLGYRIPGTPDPTWRCHLRCTENPWIREHKVQGDILYPGAGIVVMAIEAARQLGEEQATEEIYGYELRDVAIDTALRVPDTDKGIEVMIQLHGRRTGTRAGPSATLNEFSVSSWSEDIKEWTVHARGLVSVTYKSSISLAMERELALERERHAQSFANAKKICQKPARNFLYDTVETIGMEYGPTFRNMTELFAGPNASYGVISVPDTKSVMPKGFEYPNVVHPATLDSVLHLLFPSISGEDQSLNEAVVPFSFDRIFVSTKLSGVPGTKLHGCSTAQKTSYTTWKSSITISEDLSEPMIIMDGVSLASVGEGDAQKTQETRASCFGQTWHEDADLLEPSQIKELVYRRTLKSKDDESVLDKLEYVCLVHIYRCLAWLESEEGKPFVPQDGFWKLYVEWMRDTIKQFPPLSADETEVEAELDAARKRIILSESGDITVQMVDRIGENLKRIFTREVEPLQVMTEGDLLYSFYRGAFGTSFNTNVAEYVGMIADKSPGVKILEIGAGTGGTTYHVLERLRNADGTSKAAKYCFTDISPGFLAKAADRFSKDVSIMEFTTLNIESEPTEQGFTPESYDLIVCANVLHATKSIQETLTHCKSLLKPGGRLVLSEVTIKRIFSGFIMGPLPGWWLGEDDGRTGGPLLDVEEWDTALLKAGFSGVDVDIRGDRETSKEPVSLILSTKPEQEIPGPSQFVIVSTGSEASDKLIQSIQKQLASASQDVTIIQWNDIDASNSQLNGKYCLSLAEWESPVLSDLTDNNWERLRQVILGSVGTLWITGGAVMDCQEPLKSLMVGLSRAIRNEDAGVRLATLDLETPSSIDFDDAAKNVLKVALSHSRSDGFDGEYAARGRTVYVPRVERTLDVDASLRKYEAKGQPELVSFKGCGRPLKLTIKTPGLLDTFRWEEDEVYYEPLPEDWIEVEVKAVGLNFKDVLVALGNLAENKLGVDASGLVTRVGSAVKDFKPGDRVMTASCDTFATYVRFPAKGAITVPEKMSFEEAASMPLIFLTSYYSLVTAGNLVKGEKILIHAAAGGVGQAAIMIAQRKGAEIFATVGSDEKKQLIMDQYGIPEDHIFSSRDVSFAKAVMRATNDQGVDVVLNSLAGELLRLSWHCLAKFGRFLEIGKADLFANTGLDMKPFLDNKAYIGVNLLDFENNPTPRAVALWEDTAKLIHDGSVRPIAPIQMFSMADVEKAFRFMQAGKHMGKVVVRVDDADMVPAVPRIPRVGIQADATYVIAGVGGICKEIGRWLAEKGAKHLVLLSRSAASGEENKAFASELQKTYGATTYAYDCDVGNKAALQQVLDDLKSKDVPIVKGCVTGAMVLRDTLFDKMTADHVRTTVGPKVHGTWNLHELLPKELDFFVMLSSLAGVMGHRGQGNYGCGNIFQDYFAAYRRSQGLRAMTIDIGYLLSVGFVAEHDEYVDHVKAMGLKVMHKSDLYGLMATALEGSEAHPPQVMCGLPYNEHDDAWYWIQDQRFAGLRKTAAGSGAGGSASVSLRDELVRCGKADDEAVRLITSALVQRLAKLMMMPEDDVDAGKPLSAYGVDSLVAVEVRNWIAKEVAVEISVFDIMANMPMRQLATDLAGKSKLLTQEAS
ncbi:beta-ketoacyl synthase domain-containing protein [Colletotrichum graminicola]|uniref:Beta-ketoacyl synthase domain-containing protein n=1 Tax=Colletotrichum graminicola (strain M1.001 / M2 / FGSC 10212) TaxID=645133 RepID=E3QWD5_COLGM|nr:beta-ketoacyl synthase domain-containing protein [Colletotrichum graminicola M1.001]EFQ35173.1 beta-ketoacyl synthase domain-containing protein [Colletotrichum graminicola M1.001]WDK10030.1 beta-ketoacyl synthase domain-containing protein [Colletotrichum graminicola]